MVELGSFAAIYLCFACLHAAHLLRAPRGRGLTRRAGLLRGLLWAVAATLAAASVWLQTSISRWPDPLLLPLAALLAVASSFVVLRPLLPRFVWGGVLVAPLVFMLALLEAFRG